MFSIFFFFNFRVSVTGRMCSPLLDHPQKFTLATDPSRDVKFRAGIVLQASPVGVRDAATWTIPCSLLHSSLRPNQDPHSEEAGVRSLSLISNLCTSTSRCRNWTMRPSAQCSLNFLRSLSFNSSLKNCIWSFVIHCLVALDKNSTYKKEALEVTRLWFLFFLFIKQALLH